MVDLNNLVQSADWKKEKHVPVIEIVGDAKKGGPIKVKVSIGKEIAHPNTTEHHISWINLYFLPEGEKFPYHIGKFDFNSHGASTQGANTSTVYTDPEITSSIKTEKSGTLIAFSYCNIHGLWKNELELKL
ncbi:MAG: class II SORL domain-containing protein [Promethearchaeota archaeon]